MSLESRISQLHLQQFQSKFPMSFLNNSGKPSLAKPILIIVTILLIIGGAYSFFGKKGAAEVDAKKDQAPTNEVQPSGLD